MILNFSCLTSLYRKKGLQQSRASSVSFDEEHYSQLFQTELKWSKNLVLEFFDNALLFAHKKYGCQIFRKYGHVRWNRDRVLRMIMVLEIVEK